MKHLLLTTIAAGVLTSSSVFCGNTVTNRAASNSFYTNHAESDKGIIKIRIADRCTLFNKHSNQSSLVISGSGGLSAFNSNTYLPAIVKAPEIPIHKAANTENIKAVKQHLAAGTDVNAKGKQENTLLHIAAMKGHKEIAKLLITKSADVNVKNKFGSTPLNCAANYSFKSNYNGRKEIVELLIANGADVNAKNKWGSVPLHSAVNGGVQATGIAELLIAAGADVNTKDDDGVTPLNLCARTTRHKWSKEMGDLLRKHGGKTGEELKAEGK
jgi:ankyrin repeat protein